MENAPRVSTVTMTLNTAQSTASGMKYWIGMSTATGQEDLADEGERLGRVVVVELVVVAPDEGQGHQHAQAARWCRSGPRRKASRPYCCFKKRLPSTGAVNRPKPMAEKAIRHIFRVRIFMMRANAASSDGGTGWVSSIDLSEHVELLVLTPRGLPQAERDNGDHDDRRRPGCRRPSAIRWAPRPRWR